MARIIINNIGPIKNVELTLNRVNVFMGPQSCGKSTIAKIISFCSWFEKEAIINGKQNRFYEQLVEYHELDAVYFRDDSFIDYQSDFSHIVFQGTNDEKLLVEIFVGPENIYKNKKICYIPAERNFVTIPDIERYNNNTSRKGFLDDWTEARLSPVTHLYRFYIPTLGETVFFYNRQTGTNYLGLEKGLTIDLGHSSSGLKSVIPLLVVFYRFHSDLHAIVKVPNSYYYMQKQASLERVTPEDRDKISTILENPDSFPRKEVERILGFQHQYHHAEFIIEEPEQNLFPATQEEMIYYMLRFWGTDTYRDSDVFGPDMLTITTHSPYILYAINNCMLSHLVIDKMPKGENKRWKSSIDPRHVSIWEIEDGTFKCVEGSVNGTIQDEQGLIGQNYFDESMHYVMDNFNDMLNYLD